jgi:hypothetical protein
VTSQGDFGQWVSEAIARTPVRARLESSSAVVLERVAFGAGQTEWLAIAGRVIDAGRECVIGALQQNGFEIAKDFVTQRSEVQEFISEHSITSLFFAGDYPAADNDGVAAVTLVVPDEDGIIRPHPH